MTIQITIVGLGKIGTSIGLALKDHQDLVHRVGNDREANTARQAEKMGALDQISYNLPSAVRHADVVVLTEPVETMQDTLKTIAGELREGAVVMDTAPVKTGLSQWIEELLPAERHYVSLYPTLNPAYIEETSIGIEAAHDDLFKNSLILITSPRGTDAEAIKLSTDLTNLLGAVPLFTDPEEADGLLAMTVALPQLLAAALLNTTVDQPGWREGRKIAGQDYALVSTPIAAFPESKNYGKEFLLNRENILRLIDDLTTSLQDLRQTIDEQDAEGLSEFLKNARYNRDLWLKQRLASSWSDEDNPKMPSTPRASDMLGRLIGIRRREEPKSKKEK
ncbi:MAG: prephenate dehydrogenase [Chloroflexi bacterium]|nr:prephenate dehydrogenase [Chloroflexota bacterium]